MSIENSTLLDALLWGVVAIGIMGALKCCLQRRIRTATSVVPAFARGTHDTQTPQTADGIDPSVLRSKVIDSIFPVQTVDNNTALVYDPESNKYQWTHNKVGEASCSICLEDYEPGDISTLTECGHVFHRECIMGWLLKAKGGKDECPQCRQLVWDVQRYRLVEAEFRATLQVPVSSSPPPAAAVSSSSVSSPPTISSPPVSSSSPVSPPPDAPPDSPQVSST